MNKPLPKNALHERSHRTKPHQLKGIAGPVIDLTEQANRVSLELPFTGVDLDIEEQRKLEELR